MLHNESRLLVADNSGAKELLVIRCLGSSGSSNQKSINIGDSFIASVKKADPNKDVKKGQVVKALIITSRKGIKRDNSFIKFSKNYAILVKKEDEQPIGTRILIPVLREFEQLRDKKYKKILSLAKDII